MSKTTSLIPKNKGVSRTLEARELITDKFRLSQAQAYDPFLREAQRRWDRAYFDQTYTRESNGTCFVDAKVDHIGDHIAKLLKKVRRVEVNPDNCPAFGVLAAEGVGDAAIYRTQLANTLSFNLNRRLGNTTTGCSSLSDAKDLLIDALPQHYTEPHEHRGFRDSQLRSDVRNVGIPALHMAHLILANYCDEDPVRAHVERLADRVR